MLQLYRDILRACRRFHWTDHNGEMWGRVLARNARYEFEQARHEKVRTMKMKRGQDSMDTTQLTVTDHDRILK